MTDLRSAANVLGGEVSGGQIRCPAPGHSKKDRSLTVKFDPKAPDGFVVYSHAGDDDLRCKDYVRDKLGLGPFKPSGGAKPKIVATYDYTDEAGELRYQVVRYDNKDFRHRYPNGAGGWHWKKDEAEAAGRNVGLVPYHLPDVAKAVASGQPVYIVEGEKDANALDRLGVIATCNNGGAGNWKEEHSRPFRGGNVLIVPDKDEAGEHHLNDVADKLTGVAKTIKVLRLAGDGKDASDWLAAGGTVDKLWQLADAAPEWSASLPADDLIFFADIEPDCRKRQIVEGVISEDDLVGTYGKPKCGKSVLVGDRNFHVAAGLDDWLGHAVTQCGVLHVAAERAAVVKRRYAALRKHYGITNIPLAVRGRRVDLCSNDRDAKTIVECCKRMEDITQIRTGLVCVETVNRVLAGGDENSPKDMGALVDNLALIQELARVALNYVHHIPADGSNRLRGHGSLFGASDVLESVQKHGKLFSSTIEDANDTPEGGKIVFSLRGVGLYHDPVTGEVTEAPIVVPHEGDVPKATKQKLTAKQKLAFDALTSLIAEGGKKLPPALGLPLMLLAVSIEAFKRECYRRGILHEHCSNPRADFSRLKDQLKARGLVAEIDGLIWIATTEP